MGKLFFPAVLACFLVLEGDPAIAVSPSEGERLFVEGTSFFRAPGAERDASKGLAKLQASAALGYRFAPYGLCIALSAEAEIINLVESYAWCRVAAQRNNKFSERSDSRALEVLGRITVTQGMEAVAAAKSKATAYEAAFKDEP